MNESTDPNDPNAPRVGNDPRPAPEEPVTAPPPDQPQPLVEPPSRDAVSIDDRPDAVDDSSTEAEPTLVAPREVESPTVVSAPVVSSPVTESPVVERPVVERPVVADPGRPMEATEPVERTSVLRVPTFSPTAPIIGLLAAWGAIVIAVAILTRADVRLGFNIGIASGGPGDDGFWAGVWLLVVNGGAFLFGGYAAARMARANGVRHAVLVWVLAMLATGADALVEVLDDRATGVVRLIPGVPFWAETDLTTRGQAIIVLALFAGAALGGAILGGIFGQTANRIDRTDDAVVRR